MGLDVLEGVLHVVVAADDVGDALRDVVEHVGQVEDRRAVGAHDDEVLRVLRLLAHAALDQVVILDDALLRHPEDDALALAALVLPVGQAAAEQLLGHLQVARPLAGLVKDLAVPVQPQPPHAIQERPDGLRGGALKVGILHAQQERPAHVPREKPVEDRRADVPDVHLARRRRRETNPDLLYHVKTLSRAVYQKSSRRKPGNRRQPHRCLRPRAKRNGANAMPAGLPAFAPPRAGESRPRPPGQGSPRGRPRARPAPGRPPRMGRPAARKKGLHGGWGNVLS